eukprot:EG_transcript_42426
MDASSQGRVVSLPLSQDCAAEDREGGVQELAYLHLKGLALTYVTAPDHTAVDLVVDTVQLDDADPRAMLPVALGIRPTAGHPAVHIAFRRNPTAPILHVVYAALLIQECQLFLSSSLIVNVITALTHTWTE